MTSPEDGYSGYYSFLHVFNPSANVWTQKANSPRPHVQPAGGVLGNKFYVAGGYDGANYTNILDVYDPATDTWSTKAGMLTSRIGAGSTVNNGKLYVFGGTDGKGNYFSSVEVYDPAGNTWTAETSMPTSRDVGAAGTVNGIAYVVGGSNSTNSNLTTVEAMIPTQTSINLYAGIWVSGVVGGTYEIDFRNNVNLGSWTALTNIVLSNSPALFIDTNSPSYSQRFYRATFLH